MGVHSLHVCKSSQDHFLEKNSVSVHYQMYKNIALGSLCLMFRKVFWCFLLFLYHFPKHPLTTTSALYWTTLWTLLWFCHLSFVYSSLHISLLFLSFRVVPLPIFTQHCPLTALDFKNAPRCQQAAAELKWRRKHNVRTWGLSLWMNRYRSAMWIYTRIYICLSAKTNRAGISADRVFPVLLEDWQITLTVNT